jgi:hypothetical protein
LALKQTILSAFHSLIWGIFFSIPHAGVLRIALTPWETVHSLLLRQIQIPGQIDIPKLAPLPEALYSPFHTLLC